MQVLSYKSERSESIKSILISQFFPETADIDIIRYKAL